MRLASSSGVVRALTMVADAAVTTCTTAAATYVLYYVYMVQSNSYIRRGIYWLRLSNVTHILIS